MPSRPTLVRVQEKGRVTLPARVGKRLGLKKGDLVAVEETTEGVLITPQQVVAERALAVGTLEPEQEIKVKSTIPGIVAEVLFKVGDSVVKDSPLFKISPNPTPLEYVEARRNMEVAEVTLSKIKVDRDRNAQLFQSQLISRSQMDTLEAEYNEAELRHRVARERFELLEKGRIQMSNRSVDSIQ